MDTLLGLVIGFVIGGSFVCFLIWKREKSEIIGLNMREAAFCVVSLNHYEMTLRLTLPNDGQLTPDQQKTKNAANEVAGIRLALTKKLPPPKPRKLQEIAPDKIDYDDNEPNS